MNPWDVIVVGAGAAGMLAAIRAAERGLSVLLLEKNKQPGIKILMSGGTRCNLTQATDVAGIVKAFGSQGAFLRSPLAALGPHDLIALVEAEGVPTKVESTGKVFPVSDRASDILMSFRRRLGRSGAELALLRDVREIEFRDGHFQVKIGPSEPTSDPSFPDPMGAIETSRSLILTTGGQSYPGCGTTGDGYAWATSFGHSVIPPRPALVPITTEVAWVRDLRGITLPDVAVRVLEPLDLVSTRLQSESSAVGNPRAGAKKRAAEQVQVGDVTWRSLDARRGSLLFTHFGLSGPVILDASRPVARHVTPQRLHLLCDLVPGQSAETLETYFDERFRAHGSRRAEVVLAEMMPERLAVAIIAISGLERFERVAEIPRPERRRLVSALKQLSLPISGTMGFRKAEVTSGGIDLDEVDSRTMQSKLARNLHFAGEILDIDGPIGGYNFQAAFSTGWLAGSRVLE